jgi:predicted RNase H-like HicB family nuclease
MDMILNIRWSNYGNFTVQVEDSDKIHFHKQFETYEEALKDGDAAFKAAVEEVRAPAA